MKRRNFAHRPGCAVEATLDLIDGKWKGVILYHLQVYAEVPPRVEYRLSEIGESLRPVIDALKAWGEGHQQRLSCAPAADAVKAPDRAA